MCTKTFFYLLFICVVFCFQSCSKKSLESHGGLIITAKFLDNNLTNEEKKKTITIIKKRLNDVSENEPKITLNQSNFTIDAPEAFDIDLYK